WAPGGSGEPCASEVGETVNAPVYVTRTPGSSNRAVVTLTATSESDPSQTEGRPATSRSAT
ncbi:MAG TPA: hypothetical protein VE644_07335, partial [Gaiellaceae bacterium]|nr:hypothetical protein [Gaiellaceae bacterium]